MPSKKINITIKNPCQENWDEMSLTEKGKFCQSCQKEVIDFSTMDEDTLILEIYKLRYKKICGRFSAKHLNKDLQFYITRESNNKSTWKYAATFLALSVLSSNTVLADDNIIEQTEQVANDDSKGQVVNQNDSVVITINFISNGIKRNTDEDNVRYIIQSKNENISSSGTASWLHANQLIIEKNRFPLVLICNALGHLPIAIELVNSDTISYTINLDKLDEEQIFTMGAPIINLNKFRNINFDFNSAEIRQNESLEDLDKVVDIIKTEELKDYQLKIKLFADFREKENIPTKRANTLIKWFVNNGLDKKLIFVEIQPTDPGKIEKNEYEFQRDRRAEFEIIDGDFYIKSEERFDMQVVPKKVKLK